MGTRRQQKKQRSETRKQRGGGEHNCLDGKNAINAKNVDEKFVECLITDGKGIDGLEVPELPYFIVKYGPTGSGKGSAKVKSEIEALGVTDANTATFEVDKIIEAVREYKEGSMKLFANYEAAPNAAAGSAAAGAATGSAAAGAATGSAAAAAAITNDIKTKNQVLNNVSKLYFEIRRDKITPPTHIIQDNLMRKAMLRGVNIILETTGMSSIDWIKTDFIDTLSDNKYKIVVIYPVVNPDTIVSRAKSRGLGMVAKGVFRMPKESFIRKNVKNAKKFLIEDPYYPYVDTRKEPQKSLFDMIESNVIEKVILVNNN